MEKKSSSFNDLQVFAIKDLKADCFLTPFFARNIPEAIRSVSGAVNDNQSQLNKFSGDFAVYSLGYLDQKTGQMIPMEQPLHLIPCSDLLHKKEAENGRT